MGTVNTSKNSALMRYAIYDFDGTLLEKQTVPHLLKTWKKRGVGLQQYRIIYRKMIQQYVLYKLKVFGLDQKTFRLQSMQRLTELFKLVSAEELQRFFDDAYRFAKPYLNSRVLKALKKDKKEGYHTVLLSGNYDVFLNRFKGLGFDTIIGSSLFNGQGELLQTPSIIIGDKKIQELEARLPNLNWEHTKGYADAYYDLPILSKVKIPIVVNPDKKLMKHAHLHQWLVLTK
jgi:phosphoserine phosphatase